MKKLILIVLLTLAPATARAAIVDLSITTDKSIYSIDEDVIFAVTAYNPGSEAITLNFSTAKQATYIVDDTFDLSSILVYSDWPTFVTIDPYVSHTWTLPHIGPAAIEYPLAIGTHSVIGEVFATQLPQDDRLTVPVTFEVVPEPATLSLFAFGAFIYRRTLS